MFKKLLLTLTLVGVLIYGCAPALSQPAGLGGKTPVTVDEASNNTVKSPDDSLLWPDDYIQYLGTGKDYWLTYNATETRVELWSTNIDGGGTDGIIWSITDAGDNHKFVGDVVLEKTVANQFLKVDSGKVVVSFTPGVNDLADVTITSATTGEILRWNGSAWVDHTLTLGDIANNDVTRILIDIAANRPAASVVNRIFIASDTGEIQLDTGSTWINILGETDLSLYDNSTSQFFDTRGTGIIGSGTTVEASLGTTVSAGELDFDPATQAELDSHVGTSTAHHTKPTAGTGLTDTSNVWSVNLGTSIETGEITDGTILPGDIDDNSTSPGGNQLLGYNSSTGKFAWFTDQTSTGGGAEHYPLSLAGSPTYLALDTTNQVLTMSAIPLADLAFDTATQAEMDTHEANTDAHHTRPVTLNGRGVSVTAEGGGYVVASDSASLQAESDLLAFRFVFAHDQVGTYSIIGGKDSAAGGTREWHLISRLNGALRLALFDYASSTNYDFWGTAEGLLVDGRIHDVIGSYDGTNAVFFVDGVQHSATNTPGGTGFEAFADTPGRFALGCNDSTSSSPMKGRFYSAALFNRIPTAAEAALIYDSGQIPGEWLQASITNRITDVARNANFTSTATDWEDYATGHVTLDQTNDELDITAAAANDGGRLTGAYFDTSLGFKKVRVSGNVTAINLDSATGWDLKADTAGDVLLKRITATGAFETEVTVSEGDVLNLLLTVAGTPTTLATLSITNLKIVHLGAVAQWEFDEGIGYQIRDQSSNGNHLAWYQDTGIHWLYKKRHGQVVGSGFTGNSTILNPSFIGLALPPKALIDSVIIRETAGNNPTNPYISTSAGVWADRINIGRDMGASEIRSLGLLNTFPGQLDSVELFINCQTWNSARLNVTITYSTYD